MHIVTRSLFLTPVIFHTVILICCRVREVSTADFTIDLDPFWELFKKIYSRGFEDDDEDERRQLWEGRTVDMIKHNIKADLGFSSFRRGMNAYSDFTDEEIAKFLKGYIEPPGYQSNCSKWVGLSNLQHPENVDWRDEGLVTSVKNQGRCGCCWAFTSAGALEGQNKKKTGDLVSLSAQQLVDCSTNDVNSGCDGGMMAAAFDYLKKCEGLNTDNSYPYEEVQGECKNKPETIGATCSGYVELPEGDENALKDTVATIGPVAVAIDSDHESFMSYKTGIYDEPQCSNTQFDHAVLVIGYGTDDGMDYWLIKNSWGESWGMKGYMKMARNKNNMCGIANKASYPLV